MQKSQRDKINVMHLIASTDFGGAEKIILSLASSIDIERFNVSFCLFLDRRRDKNELLYMLERRAHKLNSVEIRRTLEARQFKQFYKIIKSNQFDVLHSHGYRADLFGLIMGKMLGIPIVSTVHGWTSATRRLKVYEFCQRRWLKYFDVVIVVSGEGRRRLVEGGVRPERIVKVNNAIDIYKYADRGSGNGLREELGIGPGTRVIGAVGRLSVEKGLTYFLSAGAQVVEKDPRVKLALVGEGPQRKELEALAWALGIHGSVIFLGYRPDLDRIYPVLDVFVLPSMTEGIPMALLEAMAFSRPVIASNVGGVPEVVQDGVSGILVEPKNVDQLAQKMWDVLCHPDLGAELGRRARKCVESNFDSREWIKKVEEIYIRLVQRNRSEVDSWLAVNT
ncbi:MAG: glycosyltransferase [Candidatus Binatia bacterium]